MILWFDAGAACTAGCVVLALRAWLVPLYAFPPSLVAFLGGSNLAYAAYAGSLATRASQGKTPARLAIDVLVFANATWAAVCAALVIASWRSASPLGLAHVAFEGLFVGALALAEYRWVRPFARAQPASSSG